MKKRILLVNEDPAVRRMMSRVLTGEGHQVVIAEPDRAMLRAASREELDVVLFDADIKDANPVHLLRQLGPPDRLPPTILFSDRAEQIRAEGFNFNIAEVMEKPPDLHRLLEIIEKLPTLASGASWSVEKSEV